MPKRSIDARLLEAQVAIDNGLNDGETAGYLAQYGYDADRINEGKALYDQAQQLVQKQKVEYGEQYEASSALQSALDAADDEYMRLVKIARIALKSNIGAQTKLGLIGKRKATTSGWLLQTRQFYTNVLADASILAELAKFGITQEKLQAAQQLVDEVEAANATQEKEKGEAQQATLERDAALEKLDEWISDYLAIARIALEDKPQLQEKLGIKAV